MKKIKTILKLDKNSSEIRNSLILSKNFYCHTRLISIISKSVFQSNSILAFLQNSLHHTESAMKSSKLTGFAFFLFLMVFIAFEQSKSEDYSITINNNPAPGLLQFNGFSSDAFHLIDNYGTNLAPNQANTKSSNFKRLQNNTWITLSNKKYYLYDEFINLKDSIPNPTNLNLDFHDVILLSNGNYLLLLNEVKILDLSNKVEGGKTNAKVIFNVLVETDRTGNIYWRWNIEDHIEISDVTDYYDLSQNSIDLTHINSLFEDSDGNIIISIRHFDEVAKINKASGNFMWRMGGSKCKNNQFTFTNDTVNGFVGFSHQHTVQRLSNGNILMFDNGNLKESPYSRAVEYSINESQRTATKVWEYKAVPDIFQSLMGSVQRLPNGNTLINWTSNKIQEIKPDKSIAFEMTFSNAMIYRAGKYVTVMKHVQKDISSNQLYDFSTIDYLSGVQIDVASKSNSGNVDLQIFDYSPKIAQFSDSGFTKIYPYRFVLTSDNINTLSGSIYVNIGKYSKIANPDKITIYHRPKEASGIFQPLATSYNTFSNELIASFPSFGEFVIASNKLDTPVLIAPINNQVAPPNGKLEWKSTIGATKYQIQLDSTKAYKKPIFDLNIVGENFFNYSNLKKIDSCYWRVRAINNKDTSAWSDNGRFTTLLTTPKLLSPLSDSLNLPVNLTFNWLAVQGATSYNLIIAEDINFTVNPIAKNSNSTSISLSNFKNSMKYYWKIQAVRSTDSSNWSNIWNFETILPTPNLKYPEHQKQNLEVNPILSWDYKIPAINFKVEISKTANFTQIIIDTTISDKILQIQELESKFQYYWRVRAIGENRLSNWSYSWTFITGNGFNLAKTTHLSPLNNSHNYVAGNIKWTKVSNATKYRLQIFKNTDKVNPIEDVTLTKNEFAYKNLNYSSSYLWRVMALSTYSEGKWSDFWEFFTLPKSDIVKLVSPLYDELQIPVNCKLEWFDVAEISAFELQVAEDEQFTNLIINSNNVKVNFYYLSNLKLSTKYFWRVRFIEGNTESKWSNVWFFTTETKNRLNAAQLVYPSELDSEVEADCILKWSKVSGATTYQIAIATDAEFHNMIYKISNIKDTTYSMTNLDHNQRYFWRISANNEDSQSPWSESFNFLTALKTPDILYPTNNMLIKGENITLSWNKTEFDEFFRIEIAKNIEFTDALLIFEDIATEKFDISLAKSNKYYLRIKSFGDNNQSLWSTPISFEILSETDVANDDDNKYFIYPSPSNDYIYINDLESGSEYSIYDINGKLIITNIYNNVIDLKNYTSGQYFIKFNEITMKFVKE